MNLLASTFRLAAADIANGHGTATVTLRSGAAFHGRVNKQLTNEDVLHLTAVGGGGWHTIDWNEIAAITGER